LIVASTPNAQSASPSLFCRVVATGDAVAGAMSAFRSGHSEEHRVSPSVVATVPHALRVVKFEGTPCTINAVGRPYQLRQRADRQLETRQRIIEATIELHQTVGPAATTITQISERAGVGRVTVYRHFPEPLALDRACSGLYFERNPAPDPGSWRPIADPLERLRAGLAETYAYHARTEQMIARALADARDHPVMAPYHAHWARAVRVLLEPWPVRGRRRKQLRAALALAVSFDSWRTLVRDQRLSHPQAIDLVERLTRESAATDRADGRSETVGGIRTTSG
jgi:AcrR family transcriptional regulator